MPVLARIAYAHGATPLTLLVLRFSVAWVALAAASRIGGRSRMHEVPASARLVGIALGAVGYAGTAIGFFSSLNYVPAQMAALLFYTYPAVVGAGVVVLHRRLPSGSEALALALALAGAALVAGGALQPVHGRGVALAFGAAVCYAGYILVGDAATAKAPAVLSARWVVAGAALSTLVVTIATGHRFGGIGLAGWLAATALGLLSTAYAISAFLAGLARVGPVTASILSSAEPLVATALAAVLLGERLSPAQAAGAGLVVVAMVLASRIRASREGAPSRRSRHQGASGGGDDGDGTRAG